MIINKRPQSLGVIKGWGVYFAKKKYDFDRKQVRLLQELIMRENQYKILPLNQCMIRGREGGGVRVAKGVFVISHLVGCSFPCKKQ